MDFLTKITEFSFFLLGFTSYFLHEQCFTVIWWTCWSCWCWKNATIVQKCRRRGPQTNCGKYVYTVFHSVEGKAVVVLYFYCQQMPWKDNNQQSISSFLNTFCSCLWHSVPRQFISTKNKHIFIKRPWHFLKQLGTVSFSSFMCF